ncbi:MAG TPA: transposase [Verrucomicrobiota bacterium]|nr:transposase [Verrucomicrobiota bacterium]
MADERADFDSPWKRALQLYWRPFLAWCFPRIEASIDWRQPFEFLDKELQAVVRDGESGRQYVDKLVKVYRLDGQPQWVLVHLEIQSQPDANLSARIFQYHQRLTDTFRRPVASLVVLADEAPGWRPAAYYTELWDCRVLFEYPICKLPDFSDARLAEADNPVALVIAAQRAAQRTAGEPVNRRQAKWRLVRHLVAKGYERQDVLELLVLIDWLLTLPLEQEVEFRREWVEFEQENVMPFVSSFERWAREEGQTTSTREAILDALSARFGEVPVDVLEIIKVTTDLNRLREWHRLAIIVGSLSAFRAAVLEPFKVQV